MQYPALALLAPLIGSFLTILAAWTSRRVGLTVGALTLAASVLFSALTLAKVIAEGPMTYLFGGWEAPWGIVLNIDTFSALMLCLVSTTALLNLLSYRMDFERRMPEKTASLLALYMLTTAGHMGIVATGDIFNLYVFIEVAALSGYAMLSLGGARAAMASLNYLLIGSVGASLYLLGVGYLYIQSGSLNMLDVGQILAAEPASTTLLAGFVILVAGVWVKMALFPFHAWLPGAYGRSTMPVASLLAPMTTKVMAYVLVRMLITVYPGDVTEHLPQFSDIAVWLASVAIVVAAAMALAQRNLRAMLCYILVAEVGYMSGGAFLGNAAGTTGTMLHILADAAMTLTLFMALGNIAKRRGGHGFDRLHGLFASMPVTMAFFVFGALSMIGVPPFCGFYSKWYLLSGSLEAGQYQFMVALILSSLVNVVLFFRVFELAFFRKPDSPTMEEVDWTRLVPLGIAAAALPLIGLLTGSIVDFVIAPSLGAGPGQTLVSGL